MLILLINDLCDSGRNNDLQGTSNLDNDRREIFEKSSCIRMFFFCLDKYFNLIVMSSPQLMPNDDTVAMPENPPKLEVEMASTNLDMPSTNGVQAKASTTEEAAKETESVPQKKQNSSPTEGENKRQHTKATRVSDVYRPYYGESPERKYKVSETRYVQDLTARNGTVTPIDMDVRCQTRAPRSPSPRNLGRYQRPYRSPHELENGYTQEEVAFHHEYNAAPAPM